MLLWVSSTCKSSVDSSTVGIRQADGRTAAYRDGPAFRAGDMARRLCLEADIVSEGNLRLYRKRLIEAESHQGYVAAGMVSRSL